MKNFNSLLSGIMVLCASLVLFSCKKQITESIPDQLPMQASTANECKPALLGVYSFYPNSPANGEWLTLAQKWYENDKVKYLKAMHGGWSGAFLDPILDFMFDLNWGEVTYEGNQVNIKDVLNNRMKFRVTLDNHGRPVASYYHYDYSSDGYMHDTTYYYYDGDRLDYIISLYKITYGGPEPTYQWRKFIFSYDDWGNVIKAEFQGNTRLTVQYDYAKPVTGILDNFHITSSLKLLEYLELIDLPMHHAVTSTTWSVYSGGLPPNENYYEMRRSAYKNYVIADGLVRSYEYDDTFGNRTVTFYNGWECGMNISSTSATAIVNRQQFQQLYPGNNK